MAPSRCNRITLAIATTFEVLLITSLVGIFTVAYPSRFRAALWQDGGSKGWNSDPAARIYFYANYTEPPPVPMVWDSRLTLYNLITSLLSLVLCAVRTRINISLDTYSALTTNAVYDILLGLLWTCSAVMQRSADVSDPAHIALLPWYLERGCGGAAEGNRGACGVVRAGFGLAVLAGIWFSVRLVATCMYGAYVYGQERGERDGVERLIHSGMAKWPGLLYSVSDEPLSA